MAILHMETDDVRAVALQFKQAGDEIAEAMHRLQRSVSRLDANWTGGQSTLLVDQMHHIVRDTNRLADDAVHLGRRVYVEVDEWESVDRDGAVAFAGMADRLFGPSGSISGGVGGYGGSPRRPFRVLAQVLNEIREGHRQFLTDSTRVAVIGGLGFPATRLAGALGLGIGGVVGTGTAAVSHGAAAAPAWFASGGGLVATLLGTTGVIAAGGLGAAGILPSLLGTSPIAAASGAAAAGAMATGGVASVGGLAGAGLAAPGTLAGTGIVGAGGAMATGAAAAGTVAAAGLTAGSLAVGTLAATPLTATGGLVTAGLDALGLEDAAEVVSEAAERVGAAVSDAVDAVADFGASVAEGAKNVVGSIGKGIKNLFRW